MCSLVAQLGIEASVDENSAPVFSCACYSRLGQYVVRMRKRIRILLLFLGLGAASLAWAQAPVELTAETKQVLLTPHLTFWRDAAGTTTLSQAQAATGADQFTQNQAENLNFGFTGDAVWLRFVLHSQLNIHSKWFFDLPATMPRVDRTLRWLTLVFAGLALWMMTDGPYLLRLSIMQLLSLFAGTLSIVVAIAAWRKGNRTARFYLLAWGTFWAMFVIEILQQRNVLPAWLPSDVLLLVGLLFAFILFHAAMADRARQMQKDKERAQTLADKTAHEVADRREAEKELRQILVKIPTAIHVSSLQREDVFINEHFVRLFGYQPDEIQTREDWFCRAYPDKTCRTQMRDWWSASAAALEGKKSEAREVRITCKDGTVREVIVSIIVAGDMLLTSFVDITERLLIENDLRVTQEKLKAMLDALPDHLFLVDRERRILEYYSAPSNLPYVAPSVFLGKRVDEVMPEAVTQVFISALDEAAAKGTHRGATYSLPMQSGICWFELSIAVMGARLGPATDFIVLARDITRRKRAEEEVLARQKELEKAKDAAERANQAKGLFLANMSHEIRTPLSALVGLSQAMCKQAEERHLPEDFARMLEQIRSGGRYLNLMLTNLLDVSAVESGHPRIHLRRTKLDEWAGSVRDILEPIAVARQVELRWHAAALADAEQCTDPVRLAQILINLVHNAIKFTPAGKGVDVRFQWQPNFFAIEVADEGAGLPMEQTAEFTAFAEGIPAISDLDHGVGLGLYVVQTNARLLGGRVVVTNGPGGGACFRVEWSG